MSVLVVAIYAPLRQLTFKTLQNSVNFGKKAEKCLGSGHYSNLTYSESDVFSISLMHCFHLVVIRS